MKNPKDIEEFILEQKKRLRDEPECASALYNLGVAFMSEGKFDEAIEAFEESIDAGGRMFESFVNLGYIYFKEGDLEKVVKANLRAIEIEPRYARGYSNLGFAYLQMGKTDEAIESLEKALELNPEIVQAMCNLANAYLKMIFEDGFYHADPHPGNILVSSSGIIIFLDFGMAGHVDPVLHDNLANLIISIRINDIDFLIEALTELGLISDAGGESPALRIKLEELLNKYYSLSTRYIDPTAFLIDIIDIFAKSRGKIPANLMLLSKTLMIRDEISRRLDPDHNFAELTEPYVKKMLEERTKASYLMREASKTFWDFTHLARAFPKRINHILSKAEKGTLKFELEHRGHETLIEELDVASNRLSFSMIIAALIIGSSLIIQTGMSPRIFGVPLLGIFGFFLAGLLGMGLIISILRSGRW